MHVDTPGQDTQNNWPVGASGFGLGTFAHPDPDALAPAGTASAVAVRATDTRTAKMTRSRTGRMGPPLIAQTRDSSRQVRLVSSCPETASTPAQQHRVDPARLNSATSVLPSAPYHS